MHRRRLFASALAAGISALLGSNTSAQLRIVSFNTSNADFANAGPRVGMGTILSAIGSMVSDDPTVTGNTGIAKRIDALCLQEVYSSDQTGAQYAALMNSMYGVTSYTYGTLNGNSTGSGTQGIVYDSSALTLVGSVAVGVASGAGQPRQTMRYQLRPVGYTSAADVYIYNGHWKSSTGGTNQTRRDVESQAIRQSASTLIDTNANIIYLGDMNVYNSTEPMYQTLTATAGSGSLQFHAGIDPIAKPGSWSGAASFKNIHTQSPWDPDNGGGFTSGGMDDRFDQQLITSNLMDSNGVAYITNSYQAFGNNGSHALNQPIDTGSGAPAEVLHWLSAIIDHLPVVADYQIPAKMSVSAGSAPAQVIVGANVPLGVSVTNSAPVQYTIGADQLQYTVSGSGSLSGGGSGTLLALQSAGVQTLTLNTATPGLKSGQISVTSSSEAVADGAYLQGVATQVLAHANPSFSDVSDENSATIDFGIVARGSAPSAKPFVVVNLEDASGFTAGLDLDSVSGSGDTTRLTTDLAPFANQLAGTVANFLASIDTTASGSFTATYTLHSSDQNLLGATALADNSLTIIGRVAIGGDATLDGTVDSVDFNVLASEFDGPLATWTDGDFNGDGNVDSVDFNILAANFGQTDPGPAFGALVPEPSSMAALGVVACVLAARRRRRTTWR